MELTIETPKSTIGYWFLTDDSCFQYVKKNSETEYSLIELAVYGLDEEDEKEQKYEVYEDTIDVQKYFDSMDELKTILNTFGYKDLKAVQNEYGDSTNQIIAECIFEYHGRCQANPIGIGTIHEAIGKLMGFLELAAPVDAHEILRR